MISTKGIQNIIFDLGAVIINIDPPATQAIFRERLGERFESVFEKLNEAAFFQKYEVGELTSQAFIEGLKKADDGLTAEFIKTAWEKTLLDIPESRIKVLRYAKTNYRSFLLSNTNELHILSIYRQLSDRFQLADLSPLFEKVYLSYEMGLRKPEPAIFQRVLDENGLEPSATLFIDDTEEHLLSAAKLGIQTYHLKVAHPLEEVFPYED